MATGQEREEAVRTARDLVAVLQSQPVTNKGRAGADFRRACAATIASAGRHLTAGTLADAIANCFAAAMAAGIGYRALGLVREAAQLDTTSPGIATGVRTLVLRLALVHEATASGDLVLRSRADADAILARFTAAFEPAIEEAADNDEAEVYRALREVRAAVTRRLVDEGRPLPQIVAYNVPRPIPSLVLAHRLYGDASRHIELINENKIRHPAFAPAEGRAFSR